MSKQTAAVLGLLIVAGLSLALPAQAATYLTSGGAQTSIGDTIGSAYDQLILDPFTGTLSGSGTYELNALHFVVGANTCCDEVVSGTLTENLTIDGVTQTLSVPYTDAISSSDTLTIAGGTTLYFSGYEVVLDSITPIVNGGGTMDGTLFADVTAVPEPAIWAMMLVGFFSIGFMMRRKSSQWAFSSV